MKLRLCWFSKNG